MIPFCLLSNHRRAFRWHGVGAARRRRRAGGGGDSGGGSLVWPSQGTHLIAADASSMMVIGYTGQIEMMVSPDGTKIAWAEMHGTPGNTSAEYAASLWVADHDGGNQVRILDARNLNNGDFMPAASTQMGANLVWTSNTELAYRGAEVSDASIYRIDNASQDATCRYAFLDIANLGSPVERGRSPLIDRRKAESMNYAHNVMSIHKTGNNFIHLLDVATLTWSNPGLSASDWGNPDGNNDLDHSYWSHDGAKLQVKLKGGSPERIATCDFDGTNFSNFVHNPNATAGHQHWLPGTYLHFHQGGGIYTADGTKVDKDGNPNANDQAPYANYLAMHKGAGKYAGSNSHVAGTTSSNDDESCVVGDLSDNPPSTLVIEGEPNDNNAVHAVFHPSGAAVYFQVIPAGKSKTELWLYVF